MSHTEQTASSPRGFGKMLNSLQGLQQRLKDFSVADIGNAEANAQTLILRLKEVEETIAAIALLKTATSSISQSLAATPDAEIDEVDFDSLENHPQLHAIIKASKLIRLHKLMTALKVGAGNSEPWDERDHGKPSTDLSFTEPESFLTNADSVSGTQSVPHEFAELLPLRDEGTPPASTFDSDSLNVGTTVAAPAFQNGAGWPMPPAMNSQTGSATITVSTEFPTAEAEFETAIASEEKKHSHSAEELTEDFPAERGHSPNNGIPTQIPELETTTPKPQRQIERTKKSRARDKAQSQVNESKALIATNESFDLRLLDDLVSNYGEFASSPNLPATINKNDPAPLPAATNDTPEETSSVEPTVPVVKKNGDLDRQLKKIIKDYGEYDLYSDKQTTNIKKAGIIAFVFLGLVFGGIYLFKAPPSTAKTAPATSTSTATPDGRNPHPAEQEAVNDNRGKIIENQK